MRVSFILAAIIGLPMMLSTTSCTTVDAEPVTGVVVEKEHENPVYGEKKLNPTKQQCTTSPKGKRTCKQVKGPSTTVTYIKKSECYELDIRITQNDGSQKIVETCDKDAYGVLEPGDPYDSSKDYSKVKR